MRNTYVAIGGALIILGMWYCIQDLFELPDFFFRGFGVLIGFMWVLMGIINLLNWTYGRVARGVRFSAIGTNVGYLLLPLAWGALPSRWDEWTAYLLTLAALLIALSKQSHRVEGRAA